MKVIGRQARGRDLWGENPGVFFCSARKSRECVGGSVGGNSTRFQKKVHNSSRKSHLDLKSENILSVLSTSVEGLDNFLLVDIQIFLVGLKLKGTVTRDVLDLPEGTTVPIQLCQFGSTEGVDEGSVPKGRRVITLEKARSTTT